MGHSIVNTISSGLSSVGFSLFTPSKALAIADILKKIWAALGVTYCGYELYRVYQVTYLIPSSLLNSDLRLIKCRAKLDEFQQDRSTTTRALDECKALLKSVAQASSLEKPGILKDLVKHYAFIRSLDRAYEFAMQMTSADDLLESALLIHKEAPKFIPAKLATLLDKAYNMPDLKAQFYQKFALACASLDEYGRMLQAFELVNNALSASTDPSQNLPKITFRSEQAECYQKFNEKDVAKTNLEAAQNLCTDDMPPADLIQAHLTLAKAFCSVGNYKEMFNELRHVLQKSSKNQDILLWTGCLPGLAAFVKKLKTDAATASLPTVEQFPLKRFIEQAFDCVQKAPKETDPSLIAQAYLNIADAYQKLDEHDLVQQAAALAFEATKKVNQETSKKFLLKTLCIFYKENAEILELLKALDPSDKAIDFDTFFLKLRTDFHINKMTAYDRINSLTTPNSFTPEQTKELLESAEGLLPRVEPLYRALATAYIARGYLPVDRKKSYQLLDDHEKWVAGGLFNRHLIKAVATAAAVGISHYYPHTMMPLAAGLGLLETFL